MEENKKEKSSFLSNLKNKLEKVNPSKALAFFGALALVLVVFQMGVFVGFRKASFHRSWGEHYMENFGGRGMQFNMPLPGGKEAFTSGHGAMGKVLRLELPNIIVGDSDNTEKVIVIKDDTKILRQREEIKKEDIKVDDFLMVIGAPNDLGQIEAKFIRLMPFPPELSMNAKKVGEPFFYKRLP